MQPVQRRTRDVETSGDGSLRFSRYGDERRLQSPVRCEADTSARRCTLAVWVMVAVRGTAVQGRRCRSRRPHESDPVVEGRRAIEGMWAACECSLGSLGRKVNLNFSGVRTPFLTRSSIPITTPSVLLVSLELSSRSESSKRSCEQLCPHLVATPPERLEWTIS